MSKKNKSEIVVDKYSNNTANIPEKDWINIEQHHRKTLAIIPCYNEESTIGSVIIKTRKYVDEILVVDDGSNDDTSKIAQEAGAVVISHDVNKGKSASIKKGFNYAIEKNFDYVVTLDGDGQHNPDEIPDLLGLVMNDGNNIDISIGFRSGKNSEMPMWRRVGKRALDYATSFGHDGFVTDSQSGFRAFNNKAIKAITPQLRGDAFSIESEQLINAHNLGLEVAHTTITCKYKNLDTSTKSSASHGLSVLGYVIWLVAEQRPLLFIALPGFIFVIIGLIWGFLTLQWYNNHSEFLLSYALISAVFLIIGVLAMFMGLMLNVLPGMIKRAREQ